MPNPFVATLWLINNAGASMTTDQANKLRQQFPGLETLLACELKDFGQILAVMNLAPCDLTQSGWESNTNGIPSSGKVFLFVGQKGQVLKHSGPSLELVEQQLSPDQRETGHPDLPSTILGNKSWADNRGILSVLELDELAYILLCCYDFGVDGKPIKNWSILKLSGRASQHQDLRVRIKREIERQKTRISDKLAQIRSGGEDKLFLDLDDAFDISALFALLDLSPADASGLEAPENIARVRVLPARPEHIRSLVESSRKSNKLLAVIKKHVPGVSNTELQLITGANRFFDETGSLVTSENPLTEASWALRIMPLDPSLRLKIKPPTVEDDSSRYYVRSTRERFQQLEIYLPPQGQTLEQALSAG